MFTGIVMQTAGHGGWIIERKLDHCRVYAHQKFVVGRRTLQVGDVVRFNLIDNQREPGELMGEVTEICGPKW